MSCAALSPATSGGLCIVLTARWSRGRRLLSSSRRLQFRRIRRLRDPADRIRRFPLLPAVPEDMHHRVLYIAQRHGLCLPCFLLPMRACVDRCPERHMILPLARIAWASQGPARRCSQAAFPCWPSLSTAWAEPSGEQPSPPEIRPDSIFFP